MDNARKSYQFDPRNGPLGWVVDGAINPVLCFEANHWREWQEAAPRVGALNAEAVVIDLIGRFLGANVKGEPPPLQIWHDWSDVADVHALVIDLATIDQMAAACGLSRETVMEGVAAQLKSFAVTFGLGS